MSLAAPGWYPDPYRLAQHRWWDGSRWTEAIAGPPPLGWAQPVPVEPHPTLPLVAAIGALLWIAVPVVASRFVIRSVADQRWPLIVYVAIAALLGYGPVLAWCVYASRRWGSGRLRADAGLSIRWVDAGWGPLTWLTCVVTQVVIGVVITATHIPVRGNTEGVAGLRSDRGYVISLLIVAVVAAPFVEEIVFRGFVMRGLLSRVPPGAAIAMQAVLFGMAHFDPVRGTGNIGLVMILSGVGAILGGAAYMLRRLGPTMVAHAIMNAVALTLVLSGVLDRLQ